MQHYTNPSRRGAQLTAHIEGDDEPVEANVGFDLLVSSGLDLGLHFVDKAHHLDILHRVQDGFGDRDAGLSCHTEGFLTTCDVDGDKLAALRSACRGLLASVSKGFAYGRSERTYRQRSKSEPGKPSRAG